MPSCRPRRPRRPRRPPDLFMRASFLRHMVRPLLLLGAVVLITGVFADWEPVPFPHLLIGILPACLLAVLLFRNSLRAAAEEERLARATSEGRLEQFVRMNAELTRELLESRVLDEEYKLQVKAFDAFLQGVTITDPNKADNPIVYANEGFTHLTGYSQAEALG